MILSHFNWQPWFIMWPNTISRILTSRVITPKLIAVSSYQRKKRNSSLEAAIWLESGTNNRTHAPIIPLVMQWENTDSSVTDPFNRNESIIRYTRGVHNTGTN